MKTIKKGTQLDKTPKYTVKDVAKIMLCFIDETNIELHSNTVWGNPLLIVILLAVCYILFDEKFVWNI